MWSRFVGHVEAVTDSDILFVENVITERFSGWFRRNGWAENPRQKADCPEDRVALFLQMGVKVPNVACDVANESAE